MCDGSCSGWGFILHFELNGSFLSSYAAPLKSEVPQLFTPQRVTVTGKPSRQWTVEEVVQWLDTLGLGQYQDNFRQNAIDGTELLTLTATDLEKAVGVCKCRAKCVCVCVCVCACMCVYVCCVYFIVSVYL